MLHARNLLLAVIALPPLAAVIVSFAAVPITLATWNTLPVESAIPTTGPRLTLTPVILAEVNLYLPIVALILYASLSGLPSELEEAARDLGAGKAQSLRRVIMPLSGGALFGASALSFFLSAGDYVTPSFLGGVASSQTFGTTIATAITTEGNYPLGSALSFVMIGLFLVYAGVLYIGLRAAHLLPRTA